METTDHSQWKPRSHTRKTTFVSCNGLVSRIYLIITIVINNVLSEYRVRCNWRTAVCFRPPAFFSQPPTIVCRHNNMYSIGERERQVDGERDPTPIFCPTTTEAYYSTVGSTYRIYLPTIPYHTIPYYHTILTGIAVLPPSCPTLPCPALRALARSLTYGTSLLLPVPIHIRSLSALAIRAGPISKCLFPLPPRNTFEKFPPLAQQNIFRAPPKQPTTSSPLPKTTHQKKKTLF